MLIPILLVIYSKFDIVEKKLHFLEFLQIFKFYETKSSIASSV